MRRRRAKMPRPVNDAAAQRVSEEGSGMDNRGGMSVESRTVSIAKLVGCPEYSKGGRVT